MNKALPRIIPISENTLFIEFEQEISPFVSNQVQRLHTLIISQLSDYLYDIIPAYASLHVSLKESVSLKNTIALIQKIIDKNDLTLYESQQAKLIEIPVYYGKDVGPDLGYVANQASCSIEAVIQHHSQTDYQAYAVGFLPGFAYLGKVTNNIATPRKSKPRHFVPAGSVGIANNQTGVYPLDSPGGWQIIGRTPLSLLTSNENQPSLIQTGDHIKFNAITLDTFLALGGNTSWD